MHVYNSSRNIVLTNRHFTLCMHVVRSAATWLQGSPLANALFFVHHSSKEEEEEEEEEEEHY
jgi:hypothetical protein